METRCFLVRRGTEGLLESWAHLGNFEEGSSEQGFLLDLVAVRKWR